MDPYDDKNDDWVDDDWVDDGGEWEQADDDSDDLIACPQCGESVYEDSVRCPSCGDYITGSTMPWADKSRRWQWAMLVIVILVVLGFLWPSISGLIRMLGS